MKNKLLKLLFTIILSTFIFFGNYSSLNAASGNISVKSSVSTLAVGKTFTVTVTVSSSAALGSWEYTIDYNSSLLKLESGTSYVVDYGNGSLKSKSYTYKFKALGSGNARIGVKSYAVYEWNETKMSISAGSSTVSLKTQAQIEASYSKNNNLKSLSVEGANISPAFNKDTLEYSVELESNVENIKVSAAAEDSKASISGTGNISVSEGENQITITVTAENGSVKTYILKATVTDPNPIKVTTSSNEERLVVKRESLLEMPSTFSKTTIKINDIEVPAFYSEITKYTLVGLKNEEGDIKLFVYDSNKNSFTLYKEIMFNNLKFYPVDIEDNTSFEKYKLSKIKIGEFEINGLKIKNNSEFSIIYGINIETGKEGYYLYDSVENSIIRYYSDELDDLNKTLKTYQSLIIGLGIESVVLVIIIILIISKKNKKKKVKKEELIFDESDKKKIKENNKKNKNNKKR